MDVPKRAEYIYRVSEALGKLNDKLESAVPATRKSQLFLEILESELFAAGTRQRRYNDCIFGGNISTHRRNRNGDVACIPKHSTEFCGMTYTCANGGYACNPLIFGFKDTLTRAPSSYYNGVIQKISGRNGYLLQSGTENVEIYKEPLCVPANYDGLDITNACGRLANNVELDKPYVAPAASGIDSRKNNVTWMYFNLYGKIKKQNINNTPLCDLKAEWNKFVGKIENLCNTGLRQMANQTGECDVIQAELAHVHRDLTTNSDVPLNGGDPKKIYEFRAPVRVPAGTTNNRR